MRERRRDNEDGSKRGRHKFKWGDREERWDLLSIDFSLGSSSTHTFWEDLLIVSYIFFTLLCRLIRIWTYSCSSWFQSLSFLLFLLVRNISTTRGVRSTASRSGSLPRRTRRRRRRWRPHEGGRRRRQPASWRRPRRAGRPSCSPCRWGLRATGSLPGLQGKALH